MISVADYIKIVLKNKRWSRAKLCREINKIEDKIGGKHTRPQNVTNYLNGYHVIGPKWLVKVEVALGLEEDTLLKMIPEFKTKQGKGELEKLKKEIKNAGK